MTLNEMVFKRKSFRNFTAKPVDAEMIEKILSFELKPRIRKSKSAWTLSAGTRSSASVPGRRTS